MQPYQQKTEQLFEELNTSKEYGITEKQREKNLTLYGKNILKQEKTLSPRKVFFDQFKSFLIGILLVSTIISFAVGEYSDAIVILIIVIANAILGFIQEYNAEKAIENLKKMATVKARVLREGKEMLIESEELTIGDIMLLEAGDKVGADARLFEVHNLETSEGILTWESLPVVKDTKPKGKECGVGDQTNMLFSGTNITKGTGKAIVTAIGMDTEIGKIAWMIQEAPEKQTKLQEDLDSLSKWLGIIILIICGIIFLVNVLRLDTDMKEAFLTAIALSVAAIPEGLPAVVTIALWIGVKKLLKKHSLIKKLGSVETLWAVNVVCTDKTGTLTQNEMTVVKAYTNETIYELKGIGYKVKKGNELTEESPNLEQLFKIGVVCNTSKLSEKHEPIGDPTEVALLVSGEKYHHKKAERENIEKLDENPFDSERKLMSVLIKEEKSDFLFVKGAPEELLKKCDFILKNGNVEKLTNQGKEKIQKQNQTFAENALRVLGFAYRPAKDNNDKEEQNLIFVGLQAMIDPPRLEVKDAVKTCKEAGIRVIMITGDNKITAQAIAKELGIEGEAITGEELDKMSDTELKKEITKIWIFARVSPQHKQRIVKFLQQKGNVVAMTGDGVNDAPALKHANIGISMGITGTEVAKEASDMVLLDDNFTTIVQAIEEGRGIYNNIRKFINVMLASNFAEIFIIFLSILFKLPLPLIAIQILRVNLVSDGFPALALGVDPYDENIMKKKPRKIWSKMLDKSMIRNIIIISLIITLACSSFFIAHQAENLEIARTGTFVLLIMLEFITVRIVRQDYGVKFFSNKWIFISIFGAMLLSIILLYIPVLAEIFALMPLGMQTRGEIGILLAISCFLFEIYLFIKKRIEKE